MDPSKLYIYQALSGGSNTILLNIEQTLNVFVGWQLNSNTLFVSSNEWTSNTETIFDVRSFIAGWASIENYVVHLN